MDISLTLPLILLLCSALFFGGLLAGAVIAPSIATRRRRAALWLNVVALFLLLPAGAQEHVAAPKSLARTELILDFDGAQQRALSGGSQEWEPVTDFGELNHLRMRFKEKKSIRLKAARYIGKVEGIPGSSDEPFRLRCRYRHDGEGLLLSIRDDIEEEDGFMSLSLRLEFSSPTEGSAQGRLWVAGRTFELRGIRVTLRKLEDSRGVGKSKLTKEAALEKAKATLSNQNKEFDDNLKVVDHGDYYTVTPDLPPDELGGGWRVDLDSSSGAVLKVWFSE